MATRRDFLKLTGSLAATALAGEARADHHHLEPDRLGVLLDTTVCIGCRRCEYACAGQNDLPRGELASYDDQTVFDELRRPHEDAYTVVNRYPPLQADAEPRYVKVQCMHCDHPPCVSACPVSALEKSPRGPVTYDAWRCIGCRYCMVACPFQVPAYEYREPLEPRVMKCDMCAERVLEEGRAPACVSICPVEAMTFGSRGDLLDLAYDRMRRDPDRYAHHVYGEHEGGGTSWLMLTDRTVTELDLPELADGSPAELTEKLQHGIFKGFTGPIMLVALLGILMKSSSDARKYDDPEDGDE